MAEAVPTDVLEQIMIGLDIKDLLRCKSVCKSWYSLITSPRFINRHLNRSYNKDCHNLEHGSRRVICQRRYMLIGSSNGLVCIISNVGSFKALVGNPLTREVRQVSLPRWMIRSRPLCGGFGYNSSRDDYKFIVGAQKGKNRTFVKVFSLKSNVWRVIGDVKYIFITSAGILCNGALHWIASDEKKEILILAYDLSKDEFKEMPLPKVEEKGLFRSSMRCFGILNECLCIYGYACEDDVWAMKKYNVKQSWELLTRHQEWKQHIVHTLTLPKDERFFFFYHGTEFCYSERSRNLPFFMDSPIFVESLVSPQKEMR